MWKKFASGCSGMSGGIVVTVNGREKRKGVNLELGSQGGWCHRSLNIVAFQWSVINGGFLVLTLDLDGNPV